jgi:two-component system, OmpR family, phosphate regulon response regulator PhoB
VVVDALPIRDLITANLAGAGFAPVAAADTKQASLLLNQFLPDAAVIDVDSESDADPATFERIQQLIRAVSSSVLLTRDCTVLCGPEGVARGSSVCMDKPFRPRALVDTLTRMVEAAKGETLETVRYGPLTLNPRHLKARVKQAGATHELRLRPLEFRLLRFFMSHPVEVHSRETLLRAVWHEADTQDRSVDQAVRRVRQELQRFDLKDLLQTVAGAGYRLFAG